MGRLIYMVLFTAIMGCGSGVTAEELELLNGYWEIREVEWPDGQRKEYGLNQTVDYFKLNGKKGYRKKVYPGLDGNFDTTDDAIFFNIREKEGRFLINYQEGNENWEEEITDLSKTSFTVLNEEGLLYTYHKFEPFKPR